MLQVAPTNLGLKEKLANFSMPLAKKIQAQFWLLFWSGNTQYQYCRQLQKGMPGLSCSQFIFACEQLVGHFMKTDELQAC